MIFIYARNFILLALLLSLIACKGHENKSSHTESASITPEYTYQIVKTYAHDAHAFTEGFLLNENNLYESSGLYSHSSLRKIDLASGKIIKEYALPPQYFAEGIAIIGNHLYQLTYKKKQHLFMIKIRSSWKRFFTILAKDGDLLQMASNSS